MTGHSEFDFGTFCSHVAAAGVAAVAAVLGRFNPLPVGRVGRVGRAPRPLAGPRGRPGPGPRPGPRPRGRAAPRPQAEPLTRSGKSGVGRSEMAMVKDSEIVGSSSQKGMRFSRTRVQSKS